MDAPPVSPPPTPASDHPSLAAWMLSGGALVIIVALVWWASAHHQGPLAPIRWADLIPRAGEPLRQWDLIVIHHSGAEVGDAAGIDRDHRNRGWEGLGYHFVIGNGRPSPVGRVEWSFRWNLQRHGAHVGIGDVNQRAIGICLIGNFDLEAPDPLQYERALELTAVLIANIPSLSVDQVIGHGEVSGATTRCPGAHLDMNHFRAALRERLRPPSP